MRRELVVFEQGRVFNERPAWAVVGAGGRYLPEVSGREAVWNWRPRGTA